MTSPLKHLFAALAVVALGASQVLGLAQGWVCYCSGEAVVVNAPDCASADCHHGEEPHEEEPGEKDHEHETLTQPLLSRDFVPLSLELPLLVEFSVPPVFLWKPCLIQQAPPFGPAQVRSGCGPPFCVLVARTVVLQV